MSRLDYIYAWLDTPSRIPSRSPRRGLLVFEDEIRALLVVAEAAAKMRDAKLDVLRADAYRELVAALAKLEDEG